MNLKAKDTPLNIIQSIVKNNMCIGCGMCTVQKEVDSNVKMIWNENGFLIPNLINTKSLPVNSVNVCPFNPIPEEKVKTEDELASIFLPNNIKRNKKIGKFNNLYVGYAPDFRLTSSSGGLATYLVDRLLESGYIDAIFAVVDGIDIDKHYEYKVILEKDNLLKSSKTKYYPVTMAEVFSKLETFTGKVAVVGIPCFIKAVRLHQHYNPELKEKVAFTIGIICGGMKSRFFGEYLANKVDVLSDDIIHQEFRVKDLNSTASDYSYSCTDHKGNNKTLKMKTVGDMWGTGFFKNNACDFCDDVAGELADISLGDAWINPYNEEGAGNNVIITRSKKAEELINEGIFLNKLKLELLTEEKFIASQQGGYNHRHRGMKYRISKVKNSDNIIPPKRFNMDKITFEFSIVQKIRLKVRHSSLELWKKNKNSKYFDEKMKPLLNKLYRYTSWYHRFRKIRTFINRKK